MSGVAHAVGKVFKGIGHIIKKIWKPLLIAVAVYFTAGAALAYFGAAGAAGGAAAFAGAEAGGTLATVGAAEGAAALGGAAAAGAGEAAFAGAAAGAVGSEAAGGALLGAGAADAATGSVADLGAGAAGAEGAADGASIASDIGANATADAASSVNAGSLGGLTNGDAFATTATGSIGGSSGLQVGGTSSWWQASLDTAGKVMKVPGMTSLLSQGINGYMQADMYNQNLKWMEEHAPGQIAGGVKGAFSQQAMNQNLAAASNPGGHGQVAPVTTTHEFTPNTPGVGGITTDPRNLPGMNSASAPSSGLSGYGMPGYGQQMPRGPYQQPSPYAPQQQQGILGGSEMPYVDSPYDQSVV